MKYPDFTNASCSGIDVNMFFMAEGSNGLTPEARPIRRMCAACPCQSECLEWALRHEPFGFWAGTTERERRRIRQRTGVPFRGLSTDAVIGPRWRDGDREAS